MANNRDDVSVSYYHQLAGMIHHNIVDYCNIVNHLDHYNVIQKVML